LTKKKYKHKCQLRFTKFIFFKKIWSFLSDTNYNNNVTITNSDFSYSANYGIYINNSNVTMSGNTFSNNGGEDVHVEP